MTRRFSRGARQLQIEPASVTASRTAVGEGSPAIDEADIVELVAFFRLLDKWDREAGNHEKIVQQLLAGR